jgi:glucose-6-phosphate 1-dehydrogenase
MADDDRVAPFDLVVFGGAGDLAMRKLLPALYERERDGRLPEDGNIIAVARSPMSEDEYRKRAEQALKDHVPRDTLDPTLVARFIKRLRYVACDASNPQELAAKLKPLLPDKGHVRAFYLATAPSLFGPICQALGGAGLAAKDSRVVLEKPLGHDLASSRAVNDQVGAVFSEDRVFRIDHYLGKETVQNLMALRFANRLFERLWTASEIDHVQITVAETLGVEGRGDYYDRTGALRDMVQNHLMQLLCLVAMEPPARLDADAVRDEKVKVLKSLRPITGAEAAQLTVRGQYTAGAIDGQAVPGYAQEIGSNKQTRTETFVALKVSIDNWRWSGVPFYLRTGKRLAERRSDIVVQFRSVPHLIFPTSAGELIDNRLVIRLQPDEGIHLMLTTKTPTPGKLRLQRSALNLSFAETLHMRMPDAYERLVTDVLRGNQTLFMRRDEVEWAWRFIEPIHEAWAAAGDSPKNYPAGSWGPAASTALIARDDRAWREESV